MANKTTSQAAFDLTKVKAELQSPGYRARVDQAMREVKSLQQKAIIDRSRLNVPVSF